MVYLRRAPTGVVIENNLYERVPVIYPQYDRLSKDEWEELWPSAGPRVEGTSVIERAETFGIDMTLVIESLNLSLTQRLRRAQEAALSILKVKLAAVSGQTARKSRK